MANYKRKQYLIKKSFQIRLMAKIFATTIAVVSILSISIIVLNVKSLQQPLDMISENLNQLNDIQQNPDQGYSKFSLIFQSREMAQKTQSAITKHKDNMWKTFLGAVGISAILVSIVFLILSHRIAGPIFRFERTLIALRDGDLTIRTHLRQKDELKELAHAFNEMSDSLHDKIKAGQLSLADLKSAIDGSSISAEDKAALNDKLNEAAKSIQYFKV